MIKRLSGLIGRLFIHSPWTRIPVVMLVTFVVASLMGLVNGLFAATILQVAGWLGTSGNHVLLTFSVGCGLVASLIMGVLYSWLTWND